MKVQHSFKVIDIYHEDISPETKNYLSDFCTAYTDKLESLAEDLYDIENAAEDIDQAENNQGYMGDISAYPQIIVDEINELHKLLKENEAAFVRLTCYS